MKATKIEDLKTGDTVTLLQHLEVTEVRKDRVFVKDKERGTPFSILGKKLIESLFSASQYDEEKSLPLTKLVDKFVQIPSNMPFRVEFEKKDGEIRQLDGYIVTRNNNLGRSNVIDLKLPFDEKNKLRQVDHRTLKSFISGRIKYSLKK